jgi:hypothetical protein
MMDIITPASESYEIQNVDGELHAISVILEVLNRHVMTSDKAAAIRCVEYVLERLRITEESK